MARVFGKPMAFGGAARVLVVALLLVVCVSSFGCERKRKYSQATPDDVVKSAVAMVKNNDANQLSNLIYSDSPEMRTLLDKLGKLFQNLQKLSAAASRRWPEEFAKLQEDAMKKAGDKAPGLFSMFADGGGGGGKGRTPPNPDEARDMFSMILADPYGWIDRNAARLSAMKTSDDTGAVLVDGEPAIPVVGLPLRKDGDKWFIALPTNMPPVTSFWPRTKQQWSILGSFLKVVDNAVVDLTKAVDNGQVGSMKQLTDKFQERALFPGLIAFGAYGKELDVRQRLDRRLKLFQTKLRAWVEVRKSKGAVDSPGVSSKLQQAILAIAPVKLEEGVRANKSSGLDKMSDSEFEDLVSAWLRDAGLTMRMDGELFGESIDKSVEEWTAARKAAAKPKK